MMMASKQVLPAPLPERMEMRVSPLSSAVSTSYCQSSRTTPSTTSAKNTRDSMQRSIIMASENDVSDEPPTKRAETPASLLGSTTYSLSLPSKKLSSKS